MENELTSKKPLNMDGQKVDSTRPYCPGWGVSRSAIVSGVACAVASSFSDEPTMMDGRRSRHTDDTGCFSASPCYRELPTWWLSSGAGPASQTGRTWMVCLQSPPNVFTGSCARMRCCLSENLLYRHRNGLHTGSGCEKVISDGALTGSVPL